MMFYSIKLKFILLEAPFIKNPLGFLSLIMHYALPIINSKNARIFILLLKYLNFSIIV